MAEPPRSTKAWICLPRFALGQRGLPQEERDLVPIDGRRADRARHLGRALQRRVGAIDGGQLQRPRGRRILGDDDRPPRRGLLEDEPEVVVGRIGVGRNRDPAPAALAALLERDAVVLQLGRAPASSTVTSDRAPSISNWTGIDSLSARASLARHAQREQELGRRRRSSAGARRSRAPTGCRAPSADRRAGGSGRPAGARGTPSRSACQRPLSAFQSFSRRSEQIQISVRPALLALM